MSTSVTPPTPPASASFWKRVGDFFHEAGNLVSEGFIKMFGKQAATQFASASLALLKTTVGQIALNAVSEAAKAVDNRPGPSPPI